MKKNIASGYEAKRYLVWYSVIECVHMSIAIDQSITKQILIDILGQVERKHETLKYI